MNLSGNDTSVHNIFYFLCCQLVCEGIMEEEIRKIQKDLKCLNKGEKTKYMHKQQENFLKNINSKELLEKIRKFRTLNFRNMKEQEIANALLEVLKWNGIFSYIVNMGTYPVNTPFFRIRKLDSSLISNDNLRVYSDFWEPPESCVKTLGRLNKKGESLLYVTPEDPHVPLKELRVTEGEYYALIKYIASKPVKVNIIGGQYNYNALGITDNTVILNNDLLNDFLRDEFSRDVGVGTEYLYKISEIIAKWYFDLPPEVVQDAWAYSSVQDKAKYNVCFRPNIAHKILELQGALICKKDKTDDIKVHCIALCSDKDKPVEFYPLGSEQQKKIFPEICI